MTETIIKKSIYIKASREQVWAYLTQPELLGKWFHVPKSALTAGASYEMFGRESGDKLMWGEVQEAQPYDRLAYTFSIGPMQGANSTVVWTLEEVSGGTRLSLEHSGLPQGAEPFGLTLALDKGWDAHIADLRTELIALAG
jgi:uncharacterized protein YndB with AHSA1/START domain